VPIGVHNNIDEVRVIERCCGGVEFVVGEGPVWRPFLPQQSGEFAAVSIEPGSAAVTMEVVLVPEPALGAAAAVAASASR